MPAEERACSRRRDGHGGSSTGVRAVGAPLQPWLQAQAHAHPPILDILGMHIPGHVLGWNGPGQHFAPMPMFAPQRPSPHGPYLACSPNSCMHACMLPPLPSVYKHASRVEASPVASTVWRAASRRRPRPPAHVTAQRPPRSSCHGTACAHLRHTAACTHALRGEMLPQTHAERLSLVRSGAGRCTPRRR